MAMPSRESGGVSLLAGASSLAPSRCKAPASGWGGLRSAAAPRESGKQVGGRKRGLQTPLAAANGVSCR